MLLIIRLSWFFAAIHMALMVKADEPITWENVATPAANSSEEPISANFSEPAATRFLDQAALDWTKRRKCFTCHTNYAYLLVRPKLGGDQTAHQQVRKSLEELVTVRWPKSGPRWDAEVVMSAAVLASHDAATTGKLHAVTRQALDRMWTVQKATGGFDWLKCGWPPMESDDHYGACMALIALGVVPESYQATPAAQEGLKKLLAYLQKNPPPTLHHRAMLVWAASQLPQVTSPAEMRRTVSDLRALQHQDGGWAAASLGPWERADKKPQDLDTSDGYGTGFVIFVMRRAGVPASDPAIQRGLHWLRSNQRKSGRWYTRSLNRDNKHYLSHAGTAFAMMAFDACRETIIP